MGYELTQESIHAIEKQPNWFRACWIDLVLELPKSIQDQLKNDPKTWRNSNQFVNWFTWF